MMNKLYHFVSYWNWGQVESTFGFRGVKFTSYKYFKRRGWLVQSPSRTSVITWLFYISLLETFLLLLTEPFERLWYSFTEVQLTLLIMKEVELIAIKTRMLINVECAIKIAKTTVLWSLYSLKRISYFNKEI